MPKFRIPIISNIQDRIDQKRAEVEEKKRLEKERLKKQAIMGFSFMAFALIVSLVTTFISPEDNKPTSKNPASSSTESFTLDKTKQQNHDETESKTDDNTELSVNELFDSKMKNYSLMYRNRSSQSAFVYHYYYVNFNLNEVLCGTVFYTKSGDVSQISLGTSKIDGSFEEGWKFDNRLSSYRYENDKVYEYNEKGNKTDEFFAVIGEDFKDDKFVKQAKEYFIKDPIATLEKRFIAD